MRHAYFFLGIAVLMISITGCQLGSDGNQHQHSKKDQEATSSKSISFVAHKAEGILLPGDHKKYSDDGTESGFVSTMDPKSVEIFSHSETFFDLDKEGEECEDARFIRLSLAGEEMILDGRNVYEVTKVYPELQLGKDRVDLLETPNFQIGPMDWEEGLIDCISWTLLVIRKKDHSLHLIGFPANSEDLNYHHAALFSYPGGAELISKVTSESGKIKLEIFVGYQDGTRTYSLFVSEKDGQFISVEKDWTALKF